MTPRVRRCPFCGSKAEVMTSYIEGRKKVVCSNGNCYVRPGVIAPTEEKAIERWNMRSKA